MGLLILLDGDDTLWETERLYDEARQQARAVAVDAGLDGDRWEQLERRLDQERVSQFGFSPERFPGSCRLAFQQLAPSADQAIADLVWKAASTPFEHAATLYPETTTAVAELRSIATSLVLFTKGDRAVQHKRVADSELSDQFDAVVITTHKTTRDFRALKELYSESGAAWSIGNSYRSDIKPAIDAGFRTVWVDRHVWEHERTTTADSEEASRTTVTLPDLGAASRHVRSVWEQEPR